MRRIDLPGGHWADLRGKDEMTVRGRRGILVISSKLGPALPKLQGATPDTDLLDLDLTEEQIDTVIRLQEATVVAFLAAWSLPDPLPTIATVGDMNADLYDTLSIATAKDGADIASLSLDMGTGGEPDPKDRTGVSKPSGGRSKGASARTRTSK